MITKASTNELAFAQTFYFPNQNKTVGFELLVNKVVKFCTFILAPIRAPCLPWIFLYFTHSWTIRVDSAKTYAFLEVCA